MWTRHLFPLLPVSAFVAFLVLAGVGAVASAREQADYNAFRADVRSVSVVAPEAPPRLRQQSIEIAMALFSIDKASSVSGPHFDRMLEDRGLTTGGTLSSSKTVTIGPSAFTSWGVLGSTLGHEIEVHARQSFLAVVVRDRIAEVQLSARRRLGSYVSALNPSARESFENDGTWRAEREAYMYELANAERFGLSPAETRSIAYVMNYYYPDPPHGGGQDGFQEASGTLEDASETSAALKNEAL
jgi:hypothetical protein